MIKGQKPKFQGERTLERGVYVILVDWTTGWYSANWFTEDFVEEEVLPSNNDADSKHTRTFWYRMGRHD